MDADAVAPGRAGECGTAGRRARSSMMRVVVAACIACGVVLGARDASAEAVTVGLFAPSAPFPSTAARVELVRRLSVDIGAALHATATGRVYARAADFAAAVRRGEVAIAVVDAAYLASVGGSHVVVGAAVHGGEAMRAWQLVVRGGARLDELKGKRLLVPSMGGREADFVVNALLDGELARDHFAIEAAPDTASALAALGLGKADAAVVPVTADLPRGTSALVALPALSNPVLVVYGTLTAAEREAVTAAALAFAGDATISGFAAADAEAVQAIARRLAPRIKRAPFLVPAGRFTAAELAPLVAEPRFAIARTPATAFVAPVAPSP